MKALPLAVAQLFAAGTLSALAVAPAIAQMGVTPMERIDVTGTNIRRADSETPSEVQVITADQMTSRGIRASPRYCATSRPTARAR